MSRALIRRHLCTAAGGAQALGIPRSFARMQPETSLKALLFASHLSATSVRPKIYDFLANENFVNMMREWQNYHKFGLRHDDMWNELPYVQAACLRLPKAELVGRTDRIREAMVASSQQRFLPETHWTPPDDDIPYLHPYIFEVQQEWEQRKAFRSKVPKPLAKLFNKII